MNIQKKDVLTRIPDFNSDLEPIQFASFVSCLFLLLIPGHRMTAGIIFCRKSFDFQSKNHIMLLFFHYITIDRGRQGDRYTIIRSRCGHLARVFMVFTIWFLCYTHPDGALRRALKD